MQYPTAAPQYGAPHGSAALPFPSMLLSSSNGSSGAAPGRPTSATATASPAVSSIPPSGASAHPTSTTGASMTMMMQPASTHIPMAIAASIALPPSSSSTDAIINDATFLLESDSDDVKIKKHGIHYVKLIPDLKLRRTIELYRGNKADLFSCYGVPKVTRDLEGRHQIAVAQCQGTRDHQEDRFSAYVASKPLNATGFFLFDGHGGEGVSEWLEKYAHEYFMTALHELYMQKEYRQRGNTNMSVYTKQISQTLIKCGAIIDRYLYRKHREDCKKTGSTCVGIVILGHELQLVNVGDSRGVIFDNNGRCYLYTRDHKPDDTDEKRRIESVGGRVTPATSRDVARVNGQLGVARAFGDFGNKMHERIGRGGRPESLYAPVSSPVSAKPEAEGFPLDMLSVPVTCSSDCFMCGPPMPHPPHPGLPPHINGVPGQPRDYYVMLGTDGIWDVFKEPGGKQEAVNLFLQYKKSFEDSKHPESLRRATEALVEQVGTRTKRENIGCDNMTLLVAHLYPKSREEAERIRMGSTFTRPEGPLTGVAPFTPMAGISPLVPYPGGGSGSLPSSSVHITSPHWQQQPAGTVMPSYPGMVYPHAHHPYHPTGGGHFPGTPAMLPFQHPTMHYMGAGNTPVSASSLPHATAVMSPYSGRERILAPQFNKY